MVAGALGACSNEVRDRAATGEQDIGHLRIAAVNDNGGTQIGIGALIAEYYACDDEPISGRRGWRSPTLSPPKSWSKENERSLTSGKLVRRCRHGSCSIRAEQAGSKDEFLVYGNNRHREGDENILT